MATFNFQLANPRIYLSAEEDSDEWSMSFDATIEGPGHGPFGDYKAFKVICGVTRYDGFKLAGQVRIGLRPSPNKPAVPDCGDDENDELRTTLGHIHINNNLDNPPSFEIYISLSPNAFFHLLQANPENCRIRLFVSTILMWGKDQHGRKEVVGPVCNTDGMECEWDTTTKWDAYLSHVGLTLTPRSEETSVSGPSQKVIPQAPLSSIPGAVDTSDLIRAVNRLFWAVVIIGLLVVLRAS